jgi:hypothetical protein
MAAVSTVGRTIPIAKQVRTTAATAISNNTTARGELDLVIETETVFLAIPEPG